jgi:lipopolysaccharide export system permease protein
VLIFRYIFKETFKTQFAVVLVLLLIFISQRFVQILWRAAEGSIPGDLVAKLLLLNIPALMMLIFPISLFVGVLFAHGRLYAESEFTVMLACGYKPLKILRDTMAVSLVVTALAAFNTLYLSPFANSIEHKVLEAADAEAGIATLIPGRFEKLGSQAVTFVEEIENKGKKLSKVFVAHTPTSTGSSSARPSVMMASSGGLTTRTDGSQWLHLDSGKRYEGNLGALDYRVLSFDSYEMWLHERSSSQRKRRLYALPTSDLLKSNEIRYIAELQWRISLPLSIPILTLLVVPISVVNPRQGRYAKLFPAIMLYLTYYLMMSAARSALEDGELPPSVGMWAVHGLMLLVALSLNYIQSETRLTVRHWLKGGWRVADH